IRRTKRLMEEQRQPAVLKEASRYMAKMSKGKYTRISVPEGEQTIRLETPDGQFVDSIFLSRGTAEQLYLSMRFALADEAAMTTELPMILDDLFVNFDGSRLEAAIDIIGELSSRRQLVLLTCHDHIRDKLMEQLSSARLVHLS
ncbi:chromosome segregation protein SMC, partial [Paenibacillus sepulcri]|nr:chromosome segregation protein SMC [Paenibacillus sepulcri]